MLRKICPNCGDTFHTARDTKIYCTEDCRLEIKLADYRKEFRTCLRCGKKFSPYRPHQKHCTKKCYDKDYNDNHDLAGKMRLRRAKTKQEAETCK